MLGHCSKCHKVWKLETEQGVCQWCGQMGICQTTKTQALRSIKSRSKASKRQDGDGIWQSYEDHLEGDWLTYNKVAPKFAHKAQAQDRDDLRDTIILNLAVAGKSNGHKPDNASWMYRIASFTVAQYWRDYYKHTNGLDCGHCSNPQRKRCKAQDLYRECPKAMRIESLNKPILDEDGHITELGELIADDKAIDLADWLDIKTFLAGRPQRLIEITEKVREGEALTVAEHSYLARIRRRAQTSLF